MKQHYFIKFDRRINRAIGCPRATLILSTLEYWFTKKPDGFYKFIEPCPHHLYKKGDSWAEELGCERRCFARSFKKIGIKYNSRMAFQKASDKFQGKMYASYYERYTNKTFFIRNHDLANEFLKDFLPSKKPTAKKEILFSNPTVSVPNLPLSNGHDGLSYIEPKNTSIDLSKDKSHASDEIVKKMIEFWTALVEEGKGQIELTNRRIAFLKKAFVDKFDSCLEKWKKYCEDIASSRFLMGEVKSSFRATLDWALKFDIIQKIFEGNYGIGDKSHKLLPSDTELQLKQIKMESETEEGNINSLLEDETVKAFHLQWLRLFGAKNYREQIKGCAMEVNGEGVLTLRPAKRYTARSIASYWNPSVFTETSPFRRVNILHKEGDLKFDKWFEPKKSKDVFFETLLSRTENPPSPFVTDVPPQDVSPQLKVAHFATTEANIVYQSAIDVALDGVNKDVSRETKILRDKLKWVIPHKLFPGWLSGIEVETINGDGILVVEFEDQLMVEWCRSRFRDEILTCAQEVWPSVSGLVVREKEGKVVRPAVEEPTESCEERSLFERAVQSLMDAYFSAQPFCGNGVT